MEKRSGSLIEKASAGIVVVAITVVVVTAKAIERFKASVRWKP
jgi:hypothetical protein